MYEEELNVMVEAARIAAKTIREIHAKGFEVEIKADASPVTIADKSADLIISNYLKDHFPNYGLLTEESIDDKSRLTKEKIFIVDPIDGTKEFCNGYDDFVTLIALCVNHHSVAGVCYLPLKDEYYYALKDEGAYYVSSKGEKTKLHVNNKDDHLTMFVSRFHPSSPETIVPMMDKRIEKSVIKGSALKAICIASGEGEVHYRLMEGTKEWDIAPIDLIVKEAGGVFTKPSGENYLYNKDDVYNHEGFIIANKKSNLVDIPTLYQKMEEYEKNLK